MSRCDKSFTRGELKISGAHENDWRADITDLLKEM